MRRELFAAAAIGLLAFPLAARGQSIDAFYLDLARDGQTELERGAAEEAARDLRLACFGMLEQPDQLVPCLVRLALAQAAAGDSGAFDETFGRLENVEERFSIYATARLAAEERQRFEEEAAKRVPLATLRSIPAFAVMAMNRATADLAKLPERQRAQELAKRITAEPAEAAWRILLSSLELDRGRAKEGLEALAPLADTAGEGRVGCLRGLALARLNRCAEAVVAFGACEPAGSSATAAAEISCFAALGRTDEARTFVARLAPPIVADREVQKAIARVAEPEKTALAAQPTAAAKLPTPARSPSPAPAAAPVSTGVESKHGAQKPAAPAKATGVGAPLAPAAPRRAAPAPALTAAEQGRIDAARQALARTSSREELEARFADLRSVADLHPEKSDLQILAGTLAYRTSDWTHGAAYLRRAGKLDPEQPLNGFYLAVCLYESGELPSAAAALREVLPRLKRTPFVESYAQKILPASDKKP